MCVCVWRHDVLVRIVVNLVKMSLKFWKVPFAVCLAEFMFHLYFAVIKYSTLYETDIYKNTENTLKMFIWDDTFVYRLHYT